LADNTPIYRIELSGNAFRVYDNASTTLDNVVVVDNNEGEIQAIFSDNSFSKAYGLVSPARLHRGDLGQICVVAHDNALDGISSILTYQVEGDNLRIQNLFLVRYPDRTQVTFDAVWASSGSATYGTVCLPENSQISCQISNGSGTLVVPHSARLNSGNKTLTCLDDADRPIWTVLSQSFPFNVLPLAEDLRADNRTLPARVTSSPVFSWTFRDNNPNDSQLAFRIQVGSTPDNNDIWDYTGSGSANSVAYGGSLARGLTYHVRIIVEDTYGEWQNASSADLWTRTSFTVNRLPEVAGLRLDNLYLRFEWEFRDLDGDGQAGYSLEVRRGEQLIWSKSGTSGNQLVYEGPSLEPNTVYTLWIRVFDGLEWGDWVRENFMYRVDPPVFLTPSKGENLRSCTLGWENSTPSDNFEIQIASSSDFQNPTALTSALPSLSPSLQDGLWYWRVRIWHLGTAGPWSETGSFRIDTVSPPAPSPHFPKQGENTNQSTPVFSWKSVEENSLPVLYRVMLCDSSGSPLLDSDWITDNSWSPGALQDGLYILRIWAMDNAGNKGSATEVPFRVDTVAPPAPHLISPDDGAFLSSQIVQLSWSTSSDSGAGVEEYEVEVDGQVVRVSGTSIQLTLSIGPHSWRVRARDGAGNLSGWSELRSFAINLPSGGGGASGGVGGGTIGAGGESKPQENALENVQENLDRKPPRIEVLKIGPETFVYVLFRVWDESRVSSVLSWLDNQPTPVQSAEGGLEVRVENVPEGIHSILIRAVDNFGNENLFLLTYTVKKPSPPLRVIPSVKENILMIDIQNTQNRALSLTLQVYVDGRYYTMVSLDLDALAKLERTVDLSGLGPGEHQVEVRDSEGNLLAKSLLFVPTVRAQSGSSIPLWLLAIPLGSAIAVSVGLSVRSGRLGIFIRRKRTPPTPVKTEEIPEVLRSLAPLLKEEKDD
jgi:hypothetical protein